VGEDRLTLIVPPDHELAGRASIPVSALQKQKLVMREEGSGTRAATVRALAELLGAAGVDELPLACEVGTTEAQKAAVGAGLGIAFVSSLAVADELAHGTLAAVRVKGFNVGRAFHLVTRPEAFLSPAARAFRQIVLA
jgi:DNA-binding transcriptional LysR family regulator